MEQAAIKDNNKKSENDDDDNDNLWHSEVKMTFPSILKSYALLLWEHMYAQFATVTKVWKHMFALQR